MNLDKIKEELLNNKCPHCNYGIIEHTAGSSICTKCEYKGFNNINQIKAYIKEALDDKHF